MFRRCRQRWDFSSKIRQDWEYVPGIEPLDFGIAVHAGLDVYYDPERWVGDRAVVEYESTLAFVNHMIEWQQRLVRADQWEGQKESWAELMALGCGMLEHYYMWAPKNDQGWRPVKSEIEFEVPVVVPRSFEDKLPRGFAVDDEFQQLIVCDQSTIWSGVVYQGRIDLIIQFDDGTYGLVDHKTAAQFGQTEHLELDSQCRSYAWACKKMLGLDIRTIIYNELRKSVPKEPRILQSGLPSKNKNQGTTAELYRRKLHELGLSVGPYADFLEKLENHQTEYFRRTEAGYSSAELAATELNICMEAIDMLNDPFIYPNPDRWNCNGCPYRSPCLMIQEGNDAQWHMNNSPFYEKRN